MRKMKKDVLKKIRRNGEGGGGRVAEGVNGSEVIGTLPAQKDGIIAFIN